MFKHEKIVRYLSIAAIGFAVALIISLTFHSFPYFKSTKNVKSAKSQNIAKICKTDIPENHWKYIVIHHSATTNGNAASFDYYHRKKRKWEHGLAYHFVIGNGSLSGDGEIEASNRWKKQIHGAHTANMECNRIAIGVCLVGNFENGGTPTNDQFESLVNLIQYLSRKYDIPLANILLHNQVHQKGTACPGKDFPFAQLKTRLLQIASKRSSKAEEL